MFYFLICTLRLYTFLYCYTQYKVFLKQVKIKKQEK